MSPQRVLPAGLSTGFVRVADLAQGILLSYVRHPTAAISLFLSVTFTVALCYVATGAGDALLRVRLPYPAHDRLVLLSATNPDGVSRGPVAPGEVLRVAERANWLGVSLYSYTTTVSLVRSGGRQLTVRRRLATPALFETLRLPPVLGRHVTLANEVALDEGYWRSAFGGAPDVLGSVVDMEGSFPFTVVGVIPSMPVLAPETDLWLPISLSQYADRLGPRRYQAVSRLDAQQDIAEFRAAVTTLWPSADDPIRAGDSDWRPVVETLDERVSADARERLSWVVLSVLLLAAVSTLHVCRTLIARVELLEREFKIRFALGGGTQAHIACRSTLGSALLVSLGVSTGGLLVAPAARWAAASGALPQATASALEPSTLHLLALALVGGVVAAAVPTAWWARRSRSTRSADRRMTAGAGAIVTASLHLAIVVPAIAVAIESHGRLARVSAVARYAEALGLVEATYQTPALLPTESRAEFPLGRYAADADETLARASIGGARGAVVGATSGTAQAAHAALLSEAQTSQGARHVLAPVLSVTESYFDLLHLEVEAGRGFHRSDDLSNSRVAMVSAALARQLWPDGRATGQQIRVGGEGAARTVAGVVRDNPLSTGAMIYVPFRQSPSATFSLLFAGGRDGRDPDLREALRGAPAGRVVLTAEGLVADRVTRATAPVRLASRFMLGLSLLLGTTAVAGVYAALVMVARRRRTEWAIRMALGATAAAVRWRLFALSLWTAVGGAIAGGMLTLAVGRVLMHWTGWSPSSWAVVAASMTVLILPVLAAVKAASCVQESRIPSLLGAAGYSD